MDFILSSILAGSLGMAAWQSLRAHKLQQRLTDTYTKCRFDEELSQKSLTKLLQQETGMTSVNELINRWRQLNYNLGYSLHHVEEFEPTPLLKKQLVCIGSTLRYQSKMNTHYTPMGFWGPAGTPRGGFREIESGNGDEIDREMRLLLDGLGNWQLARICCAILDGYYLEGAFSQVGISVLSPTGKAMAIGERDINPYGAKLNVYRK